jgi:hypothetical protein
MNTAHEHGNVCTLASAIGVELIENDEVEPLGIADDRLVEVVLPGHQQLEHHEVGQDDVGLGVADPLPLLVTLLTRVAGEGRAPRLLQACLVHEFLELAIWLLASAFMG